MQRDNIFAEPASPHLVWGCERLSQEFFVKAPVEQSGFREYGRLAKLIDPAPGLWRLSHHSCLRLLKRRFSYRRLLWLAAQVVLRREVLAQADLVEEAHVGIVFFGGFFYWLAPGIGGSVDSFMSFSKKGDAVLKCAGRT